MGNLSSSSDCDLDPGAWALSLAMAVLGEPVDPGRLYYDAGITGRMTPDDLVRQARARNFACRIITSSLRRLHAIPCPAIAILTDEHYAVLGKVSDGTVTAQGYSDAAAQTISLAEFGQIWTGRLILLKQCDSIGAGSHFSIVWFLRAALKYRYVLSNVLLASFFMNMFALVTPLFYQTIIDKVLTHHSMSTLKVLGLGLVLTALFEVILTAIRNHVLTHTTNRMDVELATQLFKHLLRLPLSYFATRKVGDTVARVHEIESIRNFITGTTLTLTIDLLFAIIFVVVMLLYNVTLSMIVLGSIPLYVILSIIVTPIFRAGLEEKFRRYTINQAHLVETVGGIETVKSLAIEPQMIRRWESQIGAYVSASFKTFQISNVTGQIAGIISRTTSIATTFVGAQLVMSNDLTLGELIGFNILSGYVSGPILRLAQVWQEYNQAKLSVSRVAEIMNALPEPAAIGAPSQGKIQGAITFDAVTFRYRSTDKVVLHDFSLHITAGQLVGVVGPSGSGKSTIAKLIQRLYVPESGRVLIDGIDIALNDPASLRSQIGVVLQENVLFSVSIRDNIALRYPTAGMEEIIRAAHLAGAHDFITAMPRGYDTVIEERGASLSGGQRQRIAIARALLTNPSILLFDEATSALDYESESIIQQNMREISAGRTVIVIAHRLSTVRQADRIITIEAGELIEDGNHDALLRTGGRYAKLFHIQNATVLGQHADTES